MLQTTDRRLPQRFAIGRAEPRGMPYGLGRRRSGEEVAAKMAVRHLETGGAIARCTILITADFKKKPWSDRAYAQSLGVGGYGPMDGR